MPELPEVEVAKRVLETVVLGKKIVSFEVVRQPGKKTRALQNISKEEFRSGVVGASLNLTLRTGRSFFLPIPGIWDGFFWWRGRTSAKWGCLPVSGLSR